MRSDRGKAWIVGIAISVVGVWLLWRLAGSLATLFIAFALAYACSPLVDMLEKRGVPRAASAAALLLALVVIVVLVVIWIGPLIVRQVADLIAGFPQFLSNALDRLESVGSRYGIHIPEGRNELLNLVRGQAEGVSVTALAPLARATGLFLSGTGNAITGILNVLIVPVFFFYFLKDLPKTKKYIFEQVPPRYRPIAYDQFKKMDRVLSGYIRGQLLVATILGMIYSAGLTALDVNFGIFIGLFAGFLNLVPYLGQATGLILSLIMVLVDFTGWGRVLAIPVLFGAANAIEGTFITPKIVGNKVGLSPVWAIISLIVAGELGGFFGMLIAIPTAGCIKSVASDLMKAYHRSSFYNRRKEAAS